MKGLKQWPLRPLVLAREFGAVARANRDRRPLAVGGALAAQLRKELVAGGDETAVTLGGPEGAVAYIHVLGGAVGDDDRRALKAARKAGVPILVLARDRSYVPHVLAQDIVVVEPGKGFPIDELADVLVRRAAGAVPLAARLPALRPVVCDALVRNASIQNGVIGAAVFLPGVDLPVLTINQLRLVLRIAAAYGHEVGPGRMPEALGIVGAALGFRSVARSFAGLVPGIGWAVKGGVAYTGTRALGEAAVRVYEARASE
ncbi:MAG: hypothetical protein ACXVZ3_12515 [Gaiellaceae bacterium]